MCVTCGCGSETAELHDRHEHEPGHAHPHHHEHAHPHEHPHAHPHEHPHAHPNEHDHAHSHDHATGAVIELEARILAKNDALAQRNRGWFAGREILALNLLSAPGAGKTTLIERTIAALAGDPPLFVIEGDQAGSLDAERIRRAGAPVVQLNTGTGCHLDAAMVGRSLAELRPDPRSLVLIENVGNLVCPALFDLGEHAKVVLFSTTEGEDKPIKYPHMFRAADLVLLTKSDLLAHLDFDCDRAVANVGASNPHATVLRLSARTGQGMTEWRDWLHRRMASVREAVFS